MKPKHFYKTVPFLPVKDLQETIQYYIVYVCTQGSWMFTSVLNGQQEIIGSYLAYRVRRSSVVYVRLRK